MRKIPAFMIQQLIESGDAYIQNENRDFIRINKQDIDEIDQFKKRHGSNVFTNLSDTTMKEKFPAIILHESCIDWKQEAERLQIELEQLKTKGVD